MFCTYTVVNELNFVFLGVVKDFSKVLLAHQNVDFMHVVHAANTAF